MLSQKKGDTALECKSEGKSNRARMSVKQNDKQGQIVSQNKREFKGKRNRDRMSVIRTEKQG